MKSQERRKSKRRKILDTFSVSAVVPRKGGYRLPVHDLSEDGIGFDYDTDGEPAGDSNLKHGDKIEVHLYLNQSLYLMLPVTIARIEEGKTSVRRLGAEFHDAKSPDIQALACFMAFIDAATELPQVSKT